MVMSPCGNEYHTETHERWRSEYFSQLILTGFEVTQHLLHSHAVSIIDPSRHDNNNNNNDSKDNHYFRDDDGTRVVAPVVYIDFNMLQQQIMIGPDADTLSDDVVVVRAFDIYTETLTF